MQIETKKTQSQAPVDVPPPVEKPSAAAKTKQPEIDPSIYPAADGKALARLFEIPVPKTNEACVELAKETGKQIGDTFGPAIGAAAFAFFSPKDPRVLVPATGIGSVVGKVLGKTVGGLVGKSVGTAICPSDKPAAAAAPVPKKVDDGLATDSAPEPLPDAGPPSAGVPSAAPAPAASGTSPPTTSTSAPPKKGG